MKKIVLIFLVFSSTIMADNNQPLLFPPEQSIKSGDLIFREGTELVSGAVLTVDNGGYSHVGTLYQKDNKWSVIHATPSEHKGIDDSVVIDSIDFYLSKQRAKRYAIYRVISANEEQEQKVIEYLNSQLGKPFDIRGINGTYCTLLILNAWHIAGIDLQVQYSTIDLPFIKGRYLLPKDLRESKNLKKIYENKIY